MSPQVQDAVEQTNHLFPPNIHGVEVDSREHAVVFHDKGGARLVPGKISIGEDASVNFPMDIMFPTARVAIHSHPYTGDRAYYDYKASMTDQITARRDPHLEHVIQAPQKDGLDQYIIFSGAIPPRHYKLVPNPDRLPVLSPESPDGRMPPFRHMPFDVRKEFPFKGGGAQ